jgi:hypothetical protein
MTGNLVKLGLMVAAAFAVAAVSACNVALKQAADATPTSVPAVVATAVVPATLGLVPVAPTLAPSVAPTASPTALPSPTAVAPNASPTLRTQPTVAPTATAASVNGPLTPAGPTPASANAQVSTPPTPGGEVPSDIPGEPLQLDTPVSSIIDANKKPRDVYAIDLHRGQTVSFAVSTPGNSTIEVANPKSSSFVGNGYTRATTAGSGGGGVTIQLNITIDGTYYVAVTTAGSGVSYTLKISQVSDASPVAIPASDIPGTPIQVGTPVLSIIDVNTKPRDVFAVDFHRGQTVSFAVTTPGNSTIDVANPKSSSYTGNGYTRAVTAGSGGGGETVQLDIAVDGTYFIAVTTAGSGVSYTLKLTQVSDASPVAIPASDIPGTPVQLGTPVASIIDVNNKGRDVFAIELHRGQTVSFTVSTPGNSTVDVANPKSSSYTGNGYRSAISAGSGGGGETLKLNIASDGTYFVAVTTAGSGVSYKLTIAQVSDASPVAIPASDIPGTPIQLGTPVTSIIDLNNKPRDVYAIDLHTGQTVSFSVSTPGNSTIDVANPKSTSFGGGSYTRATTAGSGGGGETVRLDVSTDGTYYVAVTTAGSGVSYTLTVSTPTP